MLQEGPLATDGPPSSISQDVPLMAGNFYALTYRVRVNGCNRRLHVLLDGQVVDTVDTADDCVTYSN